jgi:molybdate transport system permease protein
MSWPLPPALWEALGLTFRLAAVVTPLLLAVGIPLSWWLSRSHSRLAPVIEAAVALPIVLPPTVLGFYLVTLFAPDRWPGRLWLSVTGETLTFSFSGLVLGSVLYSLPYAVQPITAAFRAVDRHLIDASISLGASSWRTLVRIILPLSRRGLGVAALLGFAHTIGEFGVVVMLGGSIPGQTRVASIALYDEVQKLNYPEAHTFALILLLTSFILLIGMTLLQRRWRTE